LKASFCPYDKKGIKKMKEIIKRVITTLYIGLYTIFSLNATTVSKADFVHINTLANSCKKSSKEFFKDYIIGTNRTNISSEQRTALENYKKRLYIHLVCERHHAVADDSYREAVTSEAATSTGGYDIKFSEYLTALANYPTNWINSTEHGNVGIKWDGTNANGNLKSSTGGDIDVYRDTKTNGSWKTKVKGAPPKGTLKFGPKLDADDIGSVFPSSIISNNSKG
jgi:hypothetical protein